MEMEDYSSDRAPEVHILRHTTFSTYVFDYNNTNLWRDATYLTINQNLRHMTKIYNNFTLMIKL